MDGGMSVGIDGAGQLILFFFSFSFFVLRLRGGTMEQVGALEPSPSPSSLSLFPPSSSSPSVLVRSWTGRVDSFAGSLGSFFLFFSRTAGGLAGRQAGKRHLLANSLMRKSLFHVFSHFGFFLFAKWFDTVRLFLHLAFFFSSFRVWRRGCWAFGGSLFRSGVQFCCIHNFIRGEGV